MRTELFVIASTSVEGAIKYMGFNSKDKFKAFESPMSIKTCFSHDDATKIVRAMRASGKLAEGETIRVKSLAQSIRDYSWKLLCAAKETTIAGDKKVDKTLALYPEPEKPETEDKPAKKSRKKTDKPVEVETPAAEVAEPVEAEITEEVAPVEEKAE